MSKTTSTDYKPPFWANWISAGNVLQIIAMTVGGLWVLAEMSKAGAVQAEQIASTRAEVRRIDESQRREREELRREQQAMRDEIRSELQLLRGEVRGALIPRRN